MEQLGADVVEVKVKAKESYTYFKIDITAGRIGVILIATMITTIFYTWPKGVKIICTLRMTKTDVREDVLWPCEINN